MVSVKRLKDRWFSVALCVSFSLFFLVSGIASALTYSAVVRAHDQIRLVDPAHDEVLLANGSLEMSFGITLSNPSRYGLRLFTASWSAFVDNSSGGDARRITLATGYTGPSVGVRVEGKSDLAFEYGAVVSDPALLADLQGFINYSAAHGLSYTLATIPYAHEFAVIAWMGDFNHDYVRESYLNDLVRIEERYSTGAGA